MEGDPAPFRVDRLTTKPPRGRPLRRATIALAVFFAAYLLPAVLETRVSARLGAVPTYVFLGDLPGCVALAAVRGPIGFGIYVILAGLEFLLLRLQVRPEAVQWLTDLVPAAMLASVNWELRKPRGKLLGRRRNAQTLWPIYLERIPRLVRRLMRHPKLVGEVVRYLYSDAASFVGLYRYPRRVVMIASLPKSGSTWIATSLGSIPGYNLRPIIDPSCSTERQDIHESVFTWLPERGHSVIKLHTRCTPNNYAIISRFAPRILVPVRDLRDAAVSACFHVRNQPSHPRHQKYSRLSFEEALLDWVETTGALSAEWLRAWMRLARERPDAVRLVDYSDLVRNPTEVFAGILEFFGIPCRPAWTEILARTQIRKERDLGRELRKSVWLRTMSTARAGRVGDWKRYFTDSHKAAFKRSCGDILIQTGHEIGDDW